MKSILKSWLDRYLSDPEAILLAFTLILAIFFISTTLTLLTPVFAGLVIAYLLQGLVTWLERYSLPHWAAVTCVFVLFVTLLVASLIWVIPLLINQLTAFVSEIPAMINASLNALNDLPDKYPDYVTQENLQQVFREIKQSSSKLGQKILSFSIASIPGLFTVVIYLVLVPFLVYFFLLDKDKIINWLTNFLPHEHRVMKNIWQRVDLQLGNYIRGKVLEIIIVTLATYISFLSFKLNYAFLLAVLVGLSVLVPFIGVTVVTVPVIIVAFMQWGFSASFIWTIVIYSILCILDANLLVPILFAEAVNLHPIAIITAVLFFGSIWGFWGVFFAIPLASLVQAVICAWPKKD